MHPHVGANNDVEFILIIIIKISDDSVFELNYLESCRITSRVASPAMTPDPPRVSSPFSISEGVG